MTQSLLHLIKSKPGDQLRARGTRSPDGTELTAVEIVSGTFRNISGTISAIDTSAGTIIVQDLVVKKSITVRISRSRSCANCLRP